MNCFARLGDLPPFVNAQRSAKEKSLSSGNVSPLSLASWLIIEIYSFLSVVEKFTVRPKRSERESCSAIESVG